MAFDLSSKTHQQNCLIIYELQCLSMRQRSDFSLVAIAICRFVFCFAIKRLGGSFVVARRFLMVGGDRELIFVIKLSLKFL